MNTAQQYVNSAGVSQRAITLVIILIGLTPPVLQQTLSNAGQQVSDAANNLQTNAANTTNAVREWHSIITPAEAPTISIATRKWRARMRSRIPASTTSLANSFF